MKSKVPYNLTLFFPNIYQQIKRNKFSLAKFTDMVGRNYNRLMTTKTNKKHLMKSKTAELLIPATPKELVDDIISNLAKLTYEKHANWIEQKKEVSTKSRTFDVFTQELKEDQIKDLIEKGHQLPEELILCMEEVVEESRTKMTPIVFKDK